MDRLLRPRQQWIAALLGAGIVMVITSSDVAAYDAWDSHTVPQDSAAVAATVERFHSALAAGDSATVLSLLAPDAVILEGGGIETVAEYRSHHLPADIAFAQATMRKRGPIRVTVRGDVAWAASTSTVQGELRGRPVDSAVAELAVVTRTPEGWRISAIHWSSRARRS